MWRPCLPVRLSVCNLVWATKLSDFHEIQYSSSYRKLPARVSFLKTDSVTTFLSVWLWKNSTSTFQIAGIIWVKFGTKNQNVMSVINCEFCTNQCNESQISCKCTQEVLPYFPHCSSSWWGETDTDTVLCILSKRFKRISPWFPTMLSDLGEKWCT